MKSPFLVFFLACLHLLQGQNMVLTQSVAPDAQMWQFDAPFQFSSTEPHPLTAVSIFVQPATKHPANLTDWEYAFETPEGTAWQPLLPDAHFITENDGPRQRFAMVLFENEFKTLKIRCLKRAETAGVNGLQAYFFQPKARLALTETSTDDPADDRGDVCNCPQPSYVKRGTWCQNANCDPVGVPTITTVTHLIVHHSAGTNTSSNWAAVVTAIWNDHVTANGWSDIGYNWLIAPNGTIYQGRADNVQGAHFCGYNSNTMGVCMMGNYTTQAPTTDAINALEKLLAWKACRQDIDPTDNAFHSASNLQLKNISGHRDGCATECPGTALYNMLATLRTDVQTETENCNAVGVSAIDQTETVRIAPNPNAGIFEVTLPAAFSGETMLEVFTAAGTLEGQFPLKAGQNTSIDLQNAPNGLYFWKITHENRVWTGRFIRM